MAKSLKINEIKQKLLAIESTLASFDEKKISDCKFKDWSKIVDFKYEIINLKKDWGNTLPTSIVEIINRVEPQVENIYMNMKEILKKRDDEYAKKVSDGILNGLKISGKVGIGIVKGMGFVASALLADGRHDELHQVRAIDEMGARWHNDINQMGNRWKSEQYNNNNIDAQNECYNGKYGNEEQKIQVRNQNFGSAEQQRLAEYQSFGQITRVIGRGFGETGGDYVDEYGNRGDLNI